MPKGKPRAKYLRLSEESNALDYLEKAYTALRRVQRWPAEWKWVVIGLHGALYGFAICTLKRSNWELVTEGPKKRLIGFDEALRRCQKPEYVTYYVHSKALRLTQDQKDAIRFLKRVRNQIEHYVPMLWSIELHSIVISVLDALDVIRFLALECGNVRLTTDQHQRAEACLTKGKRLLRETQLYKDHIAATKRAARATARTVAAS